MNFSDALMLIKAGNRLRRSSWNGKGQYVRIVNPYGPNPQSNPLAWESAMPAQRNPYFTVHDNNPHADGTMAPWIGIKTTDCKFVPWLASQTDLLAEDWEIAD